MLSFFLQKMISTEEILFKGSPGFWGSIRKISPFSAITSCAVGSHTGDSSPCRREAVKAKAEQVSNNGTSLLFSRAESAQGQRSLGIVWAEKRIIGKLAISKEIVIWLLLGKMALWGPSLGKPWAANAHGFRPLVLPCLKFTAFQGKKWFFFYLFPLKNVFSNTATL